MADEKPTPDPGSPEKDASSYLAGGFLVGGGRFSLLRELGRGGMGQVWLAHDERLMSPVALKFLSDSVRANPEALNDLRQETKKSRMLSHPNIIRIYDLYEAPDEVAFISMEYVEGATLWSLRHRQHQGCLPWDYLKPIVKQLCDALDYAHGERVIHRDLKPANMLLDERHRLRLADFGIAARDFEPAASEVGRGGATGTLAYMSPQQIEGTAPRPTDDIYSLGATLYELLSGQPPFYQHDIAYQIRKVLPTPLPERLADLEVENEVPPAVAAMILACLAKDPEKRPQSARAVAEWIGLADAPVPPAANIVPAVFTAPARIEPAKESKKPVAAAAPAAPVPAARAPVEQNDVPPKVEENGAFRVLLAVAACVGLVALAWLALGHSGPRKPAVPAPPVTGRTNPAVPPDLAVNKTPPGSGAAPIPSVGGTSVAIELGALNQEKGLRLLVRAPGGSTAPASIGGRDCRLLESRIVESRPRARCYFQILPAFKHAAVMNARVQVEYCAASPGVLQIMFDGASPYENGGKTDCEGDSLWKTANYRLSGALFRNGERGGADFCLNTSCRELYIHSVTVFFEK